MADNEMSARFIAVHPQYRLSKRSMKSAVFAVESTPHILSSYPCKFHFRHSLWGTIALWHSVTKSGNIAGRPSGSLCQTIYEAWRYSWIENHVFALVRKLSNSYCGDLPQIELRVPPGETFFNPVERLEGWVILIFMMCWWLSEQKSHRRINCTRTELVFYSFF